MGTLKEKFEELSAGIKASGKPAAAWFPEIYIYFIIKC